MIKKTSNAKSTERERERERGWGGVVVKSDKKKVER